MATFKTCVQKQRRDGFYPVYIRVTHNRKSAYIKTDKLIDSKGLSTAGDVKDTFVLKYCIDKITEFIDRLNKVDTEKWTINDVVDFLQQIDEDICFSDYARKYKFEMAKNGQERNARNYELAYQHLERYAGTNKLMFSRFTTNFVDGWIQSLMSSARAKEMYPVCIRQIFKAAILEYNDYDRGLIRIKTNPWLKVKIPAADMPEKRAVDPEKVREFFSAAIPESNYKLSVPELGRDVAMMIMCLAGINTVDLYHLKKEDLKDGIIHYNRRKTMKFRRDHAHLEIKLPDILMPLFNKYKAGQDSPYLFMFAERYSSEDSFNANVNIGIKSLCEKSLGMQKSELYCCYTFRHTWGTIAQNNCGATLEEVGFAMNHSSAHKVTQGYIKPDYTSVSVLNQKVIDFLFFCAPEEKKKEESDGMELRISPKYQVRGEAFFRGRKIASLCDIGFNNKEEVIAELVKQLPEEIPNRCMVQFRVENMDKDQVAIYERMKGKGF